MSKYFGTGLKFFKPPHVMGKYYFINYISMFYGSRRCIGDEGIARDFRGNMLPCRPQQSGNS